MNSHVSSFADKIQGIFFCSLREAARDTGLLSERWPLNVLINGKEGLAVLFSYPSHFKAAKQMLHRQNKREQ